MFGGSGKRLRLQQRHWQSSAAPRTIARSIPAAPDGAQQSWRRTVQRSVAIESGPFQADHQMLNHIVGKDRRSAGAEDGVTTIGGLSAQR
jgi:hypothetical protein